jgi:hypothetical protein
MVLVGHKEHVGGDPDFFYFGPFLKKNREMNRVKTYFQDLAHLSSAS